MNTKIEWADKVWNPVTGCEKISSGCRNCYADRMAKRLAGRYGYPPSPDQFSVKVHNKKMLDPTRWKKPRRIFVCSMGDIFHDDVPDGAITWMFWVMGHAPQHTYMLLTKRPKRMNEWFKKWTDRFDRNMHMEPILARGPEEVRKKHKCGRAHLFADMIEMWGQPPEGAAYPTYDWMSGMISWPNILPNLHIGVSVEDQKTADERIPLLFDTPAAIRFVSCEPLLEEIDLSGFLTMGTNCSCGGRRNTKDGCKGKMIRCNEGTVSLDGVIVGAETGPGARYMDPRWARNILRQCKNARVPFFFKKMTNNDPIPKDLLVRQYPGDIDVLYA